MPECRITISRYPQPPFPSKYGIAITRLPGNNDVVKNVNTDELSRILLGVVGQTNEQVRDVLDALGENPRYGPYLRVIDENLLAQSGF